MRRKSAQKGEAGAGARVPATLTTDGAETYVLPETDDQSSNDQRDKQRPAAGNENLT